MRLLEKRGDEIARAAERRKLEEIAAAFRACGIRADVGRNSVVCRGRALLKAWLSDPLVRFATRKLA